jgi:hypothetical protein
MIYVSTPLYWYNLGHGFVPDLIIFAYVLTHTNQQMKKDELDGHVAFVGAMRNA